jgi:hypothetical protein
LARGDRYQREADEERRMRHLRWYTTTVAWRLSLEVRTPAEGLAVINEARAQVAALFPDRADLFDLILRPRFRRLLAERLRQLAS